MTCNDLELATACHKVRAQARRLEELLRENKLHKLGDVLAEIECEAREAGYRVNNLMFQK